MQRFKSFKAEKLQNDNLRSLFEEECHVCRITITIIEKVHENSGLKEKAAAELGISKKALQDLEDADYCDPEMVIRLCRFLGIVPPESCPRC